MFWNAAMLTYGYGYRYVIRYPSEPKARQKRVLPYEPGRHEELSNAGGQTENRQADPDRCAESGHVKQESYPPYEAAAPVRRLRIAFPHLPKEPGTGREMQ